MSAEADEAVARAVTALTEGLDPDDDRALEDAAGDARELLVLLLDRGDLDAEVVERHDAGGRVKVKMTRGDGVRDQDEWTIEGQGRSADEAAAEFDELLDEYAERWSDEVRELDPYVTAD